MRLLVLLISLPLYGQRDLSGTAELKLALGRLNTVGSVLMIAAHPDDENTALLAYFARGRNLRTGYLSLTRGEGGQNLIGSEQGDLLGVIRTQELLAARRVDGAEQYFTRAIDFGFSKTADETLQKWGRERILGDVVWVIRKFRPDVIVLRFSGTPRDGHGHHQSSAILGKEAFSAAADPKRFPEQLQYVQPWQARRIMFNVFAFTRDQEREAAGAPGRIEVDTGEYNPVLGYSYGEIAGMSRSMHESQGMGSSERKGSMKNYLITVGGEAPKQDVFDGVDVSWNRLPGGERVAPILAEAERTFRPEKPELTISLLQKARVLVAAIDHPDAKRKLAELDEAIAQCAGIWVDAIADRYNLVPGQPVKFTLTALARLPGPVEWAGAEMTGSAKSAAVTAPPGPLPLNQPKAQSTSWTVPDDAAYTQPYWLAKPKLGDTYGVDDPRLLGLADNPPLIESIFHLRIGSQPIEIRRPVVYRYVDHVHGELTRPIEIVPPVALEFSEPTLVFGSTAARQVEVQVRPNIASASGEVRLSAPDGWRVEPAEREFKLTDAGEHASLLFQVTPPAAECVSDLRAATTFGGREISTGMHAITYSHIPPQTVFMPAIARSVRADVRTLARRVGYVMGAGDDEPAMLRQIGIEVTLLSPEDLARGDLSRFDAIVTGVRAYNVRHDLRANQQRLLEYVKAGGTMVVQYNVAEGGPFSTDTGALNKIGPYPVKVGRDRVTVEEAPVTFPSPQSPLLHAPNEITQRDFEGWVQERGLYFAAQWDDRYQSLVESHDPGEKPLPGGMLFARYGNGAYVFTGYSWFRQLPAGVPGAFRIFVNLLSASKVTAKGSR